MKSTRLRHASPILAALSLSVFATSLFADTVAYVGPDNGNWNVAANWSSATVPNLGDDVFLGAHSAGTTNLDVTLNTYVVDTNYYLNSITLDSSGLTGFMILNESAGGDVVSLTENIGTSTAENEFNQTGGYNIANAMNLGLNSSSTSNFYNLSGSSSSLSLGNIYSEIIAAPFNIGVSGSGTFTQSGGSVQDYGGDITLGVNSGGSGTYSLSGSATINLSYSGVIGSTPIGNITVGAAGTGVFSQSGGTILANNINIGTMGGTGTYNYSGGTITLKSNLTIGSHGTFNLQSGGNLALIAQLNAGGTFNDTGGSFASTGGLQINGGLFQLMGSFASMTHLSGTGGTIQNGGTLSAFLTLNLAAPSTFSGVIQDGGAHYLSLSIVGGNFTLGGSANTYTGVTFVQTGGTLTAGANNAFSPNTFVSMGGGTLDEGNFSSSILNFNGSPGTVNINAAGNLSFGSDGTSNSYGGTLTGAGTLTKVGTGNQTFTGGGSFTGTFNITNGAIAIGSINGLPTATNLTFGATGNLNVNANQTLGSLSSGANNVIAFSNNAVLTVGSTNANATSAANFSGAGTLIQTGTGTFTLGLGSGDSNANTDASLSITVNSGQLTLDKRGSGINAVAGPLNINGGTVLLNRGEQIADTSTVTIAGGTFNLNGFVETIGGLAGNGGNIALNGGTLTVAQSIVGSSGVSLSGPGDFVKSGAANLTLTGTSSFTGALIANTGRLILQGAAGAGSFTANSGGTIQFNAVSLNVPGVQILANSGGTIEYLNATISNAFLRGAGTHTILAGGASTFNGVTTYNSTIITQNGPAAFNNFTNGGTINNNASLAWSGGTNNTSGIINLNNATFVQDFTNNGVINMAAGGTLTNSGSNLFLGGGARMYIGTIANPGGTLTLQGGTTLEVNGALLVNDGAISGTTDVNYGGQAQGIGTYGAVNVSYGGMFQPGFASAALPANGAIVTSLAGAGTIDNATAGGNMALTLTGNAASTFSGPIQNTTGTVSLAIQGTSSLTLLTTPLPGGGQSINTYSGGTTVSAGGTFIIAAAGALPAGAAVANNGTFTVHANSAAGAITGTGATTVAAAALSAASIIQHAGLTINGAVTLNATPVGAGPGPRNPNATTSVLGALTIAGGATPTGTLNLNNNLLIISNGGTSGLSAVETDIAYAHHGGAWDQPGITSTTAQAAHAATGFDSLTLGDILNSNLATPYTNFGGQSVSPSDVLVMFTYGGDANLNGVVNGDDYFQIDQGFVNHYTGWINGDFNHDGVVNGDDYFIIDSNFVNQSGQLAAPEVLAHAAEFGPAYRSQFTAGQLAEIGVPEPASLAILGLGVFGLLARLRHVARCP